MRAERIRELGAAPYKIDVRPLKRERRSVATCYGLDTEYDPDGRLVCWTVDGPGGSELFTSPLTIDALESHVQRTEPAAREAVFFTYFSLAELQFFDVIGDARSVRLFGRGSVDASFGRRVLVTIVDVARWFDGQRLKDAAASFGLRKLDYDVGDEDAPVSRASLRDARFRDYAIHDAIVARKLGERLRDEWLALGRGVDSLIYPTAASAAAALWRREYVTTPLQKPKPELRRLALACAWGGRAEAHRRGAFGGASERDLRSAYPSAVRAFGGFPVGDSWRFTSRLNETIDARFALAEVDFRFPPGARAPCLPVLVGGRMYFPLAGRSCATGFELRLAAELGAKLWLVRGMVADARDDDSAQRFMAEGMEQRAKCKGTARAYVWKLACNSLTGKWIQNRDRFDFDRLLKLARETNCAPAALLALGPVESAELGIVSTPSLGGAFWPEAYALTTGYVRAQLGKALARDETALYCATDSVWTEKRGAAGYGPEWETKLTGAAVVARTRLARIVGVKDGKEKEHLAFHGISRRDDARELLDAFSARPEREHFRAYEGRRPVGLKEGLRHDLFVGKWIAENNRAATTKWDGKRRLLSGGFTEPWPTAPMERESGP